MIVLLRLLLPRLATRVRYLSLMALSSLPIWRDEQLLFVHERAAGAYDTAPYLVATVRSSLGGGVVVGVSVRFVCSFLRR